jgi:hypothetical protein
MKNALASFNIHIAIFLNNVAISYNKLINHYVISSKSYFAQCTLQYDE